MWVKIRNNAGHSPLQIICKSGRIDERIITLFARVGGSNVFSAVDSMGTTPLHSSLNNETDVGAIIALIRAFPGAVHMKTVYGDTPLHLACIRQVNESVVRELALASSLSQFNRSLLLQNTAGQSPIEIAMEKFSNVAFHSSLGCAIKEDVQGKQSRSFRVLSTLVRFLHYGPFTMDSDAENTGSELSDRSLVGACVALHKRNIRLHPIFIRRALHLRPEEARISDDNGNLPLHIEASIPIEKMSLLDSRDRHCYCGRCHKREGLLSDLLEIYPEATQVANGDAQFPLSLMIQNGRPWDSTFVSVLKRHPQALYSVSSLSDKLLPYLLYKLSADCGNDTVFTYLRFEPTGFNL